MSGQVIPRPTTVQIAMRCACAHWDFTWQEGLTGTGPIQREFQTLRQFWQVCFKNGELNFLHFSQTQSPASAVGTFTKSREQNPPPQAASQAI
jgi:hypothetical protein